MGRAGADRAWRAALGLVVALVVPGDLPRAQPLAHGGPVKALAVVPQGVVSAGFDGSALVWAGEPPRAVQLLRFHEGAVNALAALADGRIASAGEDGRIALWRMGAPAQRPELVLDGVASAIVALATRPGLLAAAARDGLVRVWSLDPGAAPRVLPGHQGPVQGVGFLSDGRVVSAGYDGTVRVEAGDQALVLASLGLPLHALAVLEGDRIAVAGADGRVRLLHATGAPLAEFEAGSSPVIALAPGPGGLLAVGGIRGGVGVWELASLRLVRSIDGPGLPVWSLAWTQDGRLVTGGSDRQVRLWDARRGVLLATLGAVLSADLPEGLAQHPGSRVFRACGVCHTVQGDSANRAGPSLHGVFGRRAGSLADFDYSEAFRSLDLVWTRETVADLFTRGPSVVTPGTKMPEQRVRDPADMAALLDFLEAATR